jgi:hypothetical protein
MKLLHSDNGKECVNGDLKDYLKKCEILLQRTVPYALEQVRSTLAGARLNRKLWAELLNTPT